MHCRVVEGSIAPDKFESGLQTLKSTVLPAMKDLPGIAGAYWLGDRKSGKTLAATFYDTEDALVASRAQAEALRTSGADSAGIKFTGVKEFEVIAKTGDKVSTTATNARVTSTQMEPSKVDDAVKAITGTIIPAAGQMSGFAGGVWLAERSTGMGIALTLWDSENAVAQSRATTDELRQRTVSQLGGQILDVSEYEITARAETPVRTG